MQTRNSTKDKAEGTGHMVKGKTKKVTGRILGNRRMEAEGKVEEVAGHAQKKVGQAERVFEED